MEEVEGEEENEEENEEEAEDSYTNLFQLTEISNSGRTVDNSPSFDVIGGAKCGQIRLAPLCTLGRPLNFSQISHKIPLSTKGALLICHFRLARNALKPGWGHSAPFNGFLPFDQF